MFRIYIQLIITFKNTILSTLGGKPTSVHSLIICVSSKADVGRDTHMLWPENQIKATIYHVVL